MTDEKETRILYDSIELKYNPHTDGSPWEVWSGGETETLGDTPMEALEGYAAMMEMIGRYTTEDGPRHETRPDDYDHEEILAGTGIRLEDVPPEAVQQHIWAAFKTSLTNPDGSTESQSSIWVPAVCERTGIDRDSALDAVRLLAARGLVEWGTSIEGPFLTKEGCTCGRADASLSELDLLGENGRDSL